MPTTPTNSTSQPTVSERYQRDGFVILRQHFAEDSLHAWQAECDRLLALPDVSPDNPRTPFRFGAEAHPERIDPVIDWSPLFHDLVHNRGLTDIVGELLGDTPRLFKDKLICKGPGIDGYQMHQDYAWGWQGLAEADQLLSVAVMLDHASPANGSIAFVPGRHHELLTPAGEARNLTDSEIVKLFPDGADATTTAPGDIVIFHSLTPHCSGRNTSDRWRRALYLTYHAASAGRLRDDYYQRQRAGFS